VAEASGVPVPILSAKTRSALREIIPDYLTVDNPVDNGAQFLVQAPVEDRKRVFDLIAAEAIAAYDRIIGLDLSDVAVDGSTHKSPCGGEGTGKNPTDRAKLGWKWSVLTEAAGIPIAWAGDGANRHDSLLLEPTLQGAVANGLVEEIETIWLDRGYDSEVTRERLRCLHIPDAVIARRRRAKTANGVKINKPLGLRWPVERTNSWLSNFGQLRRNTDKKTAHRLAQFALAVALLITAKLIDWRNRWSPGVTPIR